MYFPTSQAEKKNRALDKAYLGKVDRVQSFEKKEVWILEMLTCSEAIEGSEGYT